MGYDKRSSDIRFVWRYGRLRRILATPLYKVNSPRVFPRSAPR